MFSDVPLGQLPGVRCSSESCVRGLGESGEQSAPSLAFPSLQDKYEYVTYF